MTPENFAKKYLTKPVAKRYIENIEKGLGNGNRWAILGRDYCMRPSGYIFDSFPWDKTSEGIEYWNMIHDSLYHGSDHGLYV